MRILIFLFVFVSPVMACLGQKKEIPRDRKGQPIGEYQWVRSISAQLKLEPVEYGYDSLQLRIWLGHSLAIEKHLVVITRQQGKWKGRLFTLRVKWNATNDTQRVVSRTVREIHPSMGWDKLMGQLLRLDITTLPNGPDGGMDGMEYAVEVAVKDSYRFYRYWSPDTTPKDKGSGKMIDIVRLLKKQAAF